MSGSQDVTEMPPHSKPQNNETESTVIETGITANDIPGKTVVFEIIILSN